MITKYFGPFSLNENSINQVVQSNRLGNYLLCRGTSCIVKYVGRSDTDLAERLKQHIGENYSSFYFAYAGSATEAYSEECRKYHHYEAQIDNIIHPAKPVNRSINCVICGM